MKYKTLNRISHINGSYDCYRLSCRSVSRGYISPNYKAYQIIGFRINLQNMDYEIYKFYPY